MRKKRKGREGWRERGKEGLGGWWKPQRWCVNWKPHAVEGSKLHSIYSSRLTFIMAEKSQRQRPQAPVYVPTARKEQQMQPISPISSSHCVQDTTHELVPSTIKMGLPTSVNIIEIICHRHAQRLLSWMVLSYVRMTAIPWSPLQVYPI